MNAKWLEWKSKETEMYGQRNVKIWQWYFIPNFKLIISFFIYFFWGLDASQSFHQCYNTCCQGLRPGNLRSFSLCPLMKVFGHKTAALLSENFFAFSYIDFKQNFEQYCIWTIQWKIQQIVIFHTFNRNSHGFPMDFLSFSNSFVRSNLWPFKQCSLTC